MITNEDFITSKEASNEYLKDILSGIRYDIERILEKIEGQDPDEYNYQFLQEFLTSITSGSIRSRRLIQHLKEVVENGKDT